MVERLQKPLIPLCVVDLDGTLLTGNSMKLLMRWLPKELWRKRMPLKAAQASYWIALRGARLVSHRRMKWHLARIANRSLSDDDWSRFAASLLQAVNPAVMAHIASQKSKGACICVASAAMSEYVEPFSSMAGIDKQLSTPFTERYSDYTELRGTRKLQAIHNLLASGGYRISSFLTDHSDDLPTAAAYPAETLLVNPSAASAARFSEAGITNRLW